MSWAVGYDSNWKRDVGYGVPAICDQPGCDEPINRGLSFVCCGDEPYGGENGCGLYFCEHHDTGDGQCERCRDGKAPFEPKPDTREWIEWKLTDESWAPWRIENREAVRAMEAVIGV